MENTIEVSIAWLVAIVPIIVAVVSAVISGIALYYRRKHNMVDSAVRVSNAALELLEPYEKRLKKNEERLTKLEGTLKLRDDRILALETANDEKDLRITELEDEIEELRAFVQSLGHEPPPRRKGKTKE